MGTVDMSITGQLGYNKFPGAANKTRNAIAKAIARSADRIVKNAQSRAKVRTGNMRSQTRVLERSATRAVVGAMAPYSGYLDFGTRYIAADRWFSGAVDMERGAYGGTIAAEVVSAWMN